MPTEDSAAKSSSSTCAREDLTHLIAKSYKISIDGHIFKIPAHPISGLCYMRNKTVSAYRAILSGKYTAREEAFLFGTRASVVPNRVDRPVGPPVSTSIPPLTNSPPGPPPEYVQIDPPPRNQRVSHPQVRHQPRNPQASHPGSPQGSKPPMKPSIIPPASSSMNRGKNPPTNPPITPLPEMPGNWPVTKTAVERRVPKVDEEAVVERKREGGTGASTVCQGYRPVRVYRLTNNSTAQPPLAKSPRETSGVIKREGEREISKAFVMGKSNEPATKRRRIDLDTVTPSKCADGNLPLPYRSWDRIGWSGPSRLEVRIEPKYGGIGKASVLSVVPRPESGLLSKIEPVVPKPKAVRPQSPACYKNGEEALLDSDNAQEGPGLCIRKGVFARLVRELIDEMSNGVRYRFCINTMAVLQEEAEFYLTLRLSMAQDLADLAQRSTLQIEDLKAVLPK